MAFSQAYESVSAPQRAIGNRQHVQEVGVTTGIPAPSLPGLHEDHDVRAPSGSTRAPAERPKPSWLLPARPIPNRPAFSSSVSTSLDINRRPTLRKDIARACAPQEPPCVPQTAQPPLHDASSSISASASIALAVSLPPGERAGKRKAAEEVPGRAAAAARMLIGVDESSKIMRSSLAAALVQSRGRRVTVAGGEACDAGHPKRARRATSAAPSDDDDDTDKLSWKRKIRPSELPAASSSVSGIKGKGVCATSAASGVTHIPRPTAPAANSNSCGPGLGVVNQEVPSGRPSV
ncbi:hypothetical protein BJY52DRAFT_295690 [Lactarius psammicola]|nr:hypothetical protein BJY52DRAFT_295690 [Lactarius psammicola]